MLCIISGLPICCQLPPLFFDHSTPLIKINSRLPPPITMCIVSGGITSVFISVIVPPASTLVVARYGPPCNCACIAFSTAACKSVAGAAPCAAAACGAGAAVAVAAGALVAVGAAGAASAAAVGTDVGVASSSL